MYVTCMRKADLHNVFLIEAENALKVERQFSVNSDSILFAFCY